MMQFQAADEPRALLRTGVDSYAQALAMAGGRQLEEAQMRQGARTAVCAAMYASPPYDLVTPSLEVSRLSVNLTRARVSGGIDGDRKRVYDAQRYSVFMVPAGVPMRWCKESPSRHLNIYFHPDALDSGDCGWAQFATQQPVLNFQVAGIRQFSDQLAQELQNPGMLNAEAADSLARLVLVRFARQLLGHGKVRTALTPEALTHLREYIVAHLNERILVADLARQVGLSPNRFAQEFSEHTRQTPYQFVVAQRLDRAAQLLRASTLNLAEVAHDCGFANQQHLCNAMRRVLGTTPSGYRRAYNLMAGANPPYSVSV